MIPFDWSTADARTTIEPVFYNAPASTVDVYPYLTVIRRTEEEEKEWNEYRLEKILKKAAWGNNVRFQREVQGTVLNRRCMKRRGSQPRNDGRNDKFGFKRRS